ncbi:TPA: hypothetical protein ACGRS8_003415 [Escherichia coli]
MESMAEGMIKDLVASGHALADDMTGAPSVLVRCLATQLEVQLVRANALAAENELARKAVQAFCDVVGDNTEVIAEVVGRDGVLVILEAMKATGNMPATDAFLAEVRAQGVEMYADNLDNGADDAERGGFDYAVKFLRSEASGVRLFADQLRKGGNQ